MLDDYLKALGTADIVSNGKTMQAGHQKDMGGKGQDPFTAAYQAAAAVNPTGVK